MSFAKTSDGVDLTGLKADGGWHLDDSVALEKLRTSLRRHGQLRPIVVRSALDGTERVVDGRKLLAAMLSLGMTAGTVTYVGPLDDEAAVRMQLDLELGFDIEYDKLAFAVSGLLDAGASPQSLAGASPFSAERIAYFGQLTRFDWGMFKAAAEGGQGAMDWGDADEAPVPVAVAAVPEKASEPVAARSSLPEAASPPAVAAGVAPPPVPEPVASPPEPAPADPVEPARRGRTRPRVDQTEPRAGAYQPAEGMLF